MPTENQTAVNGDKIGGRGARPSTALLWQKTFVGLPMAQAVKMYPDARTRPSGNARHLITPLLQHRFEASLIFDEARKLKQVFLDLHERVAAENGETLFQQLVILLREKYGAEQGRENRHAGIEHAAFWKTPDIKKLAA